MDENYYLYAITWGNAELAALKGVAPFSLTRETARPAEPTTDLDGVDSRFSVECLRCGPLAAIASRVGLDQFDPTRLEGNGADMGWLSQVAVRHNAIVDAVASRWPSLPMRLGTLFRSEASLCSKVAQHESRVTEFLRWLGPRQEWAVKAYLDEKTARQAAPSDARAPVRTEAATSGSVGTQYLIARRQQNDNQRTMQAALHQDLVDVAACLPAHADAWRALRPLPASLTGRTDKMVWNAAFLMSRQCRDSFQAACDNLTLGFQVRGLTLAMTGPWPPYHFCPSLDV